MKKITAWQLIGWDEDGTLRNLSMKIGNSLAQKIDDWIRDLEDKE